MTYKNAYDLAMGELSPLTAREKLIASVFYDAGNIDQLDKQVEELKQKTF